jgi:hypothetical protein
MISDLSRSGILRGGQWWWETIGWERANGSGRVVEREERERCSNLALGRSSLKIKMTTKWREMVIGYFTRQYNPEDSSEHVTQSFAVYNYR